MTGGNDDLPAGIKGSMISQKLEPQLYELLKNMSPEDEIRVSIWLKEQRSSEEIAMEIAANYPEANLTGTRPSPSTDMTMYEKIYGEMEEAKKRANADTKKPVMDYLTSRAINITHASMYAPVIYVQLSRKELLAVSEHENVSAVYLAMGHLPEKIADKETIAINETNLTNESIPAVGATGQRNDTMPAGLNESNISEKFDWSPKFEKRLYDLLKGMSPGDKIQVSIWLNVPAGNRQDWTMEEKRKFYADVEKPVLDYLNSREIKIQYASMLAPLIYAEISKKELYKLIRRKDVSGIYSTIGYFIIRENPVDEKPKEKIIPMVEATGQAFNESASILTRRWDAHNFEGFWHDEETGTSTEEMIVDQSISSNRRVIEKYSLIYRTRPINTNFLVRRYRNTWCREEASEIPERSYHAIGWLGEKYVFLGGNKLAKIYEQGASDEKTISIGETWEPGEGYRITANSIDAMAATPQAWITLSKDGVKLDDVVLSHHGKNVYSYKKDDPTSIPNFITQLAKISISAFSDVATFKYTWLRSQNVSEIKESDLLGIMEVTSAKNGMIELRNREPIVLEPGSTINLMGNISFWIENSSTGLLFYPHSTRKVIKDGTYPSLIETISEVHPVLKSFDSLVNEVTKDYHLTDYTQECGGILNISAYRGGREENIVVTLQNVYTEKLRSLEIIPKKDGSLAFKTISAGNSSGYRDEAFIIINNSTEWNSVWKKHSNLPGKETHSPPEINFMEETVAAAFFGDSPVYDTDIIDVSREGENIYVNMHKKYPASGQPYFIVSIPKTAGIIAFRTLRYEYAMPPQLIDRALGTVSRNNSIPVDNLKMVRSRSFDYPTISVRKWEIAVMDRTSGKEYIVYLNE